MTLPAPMTIRGLFEHLEDKYPGMKKKVLSSAAVTVNLEYVDLEVDGEGEITGEGRGGGKGKKGKGDGGEEGNGEVVIRKGDEVGIIPPVSSG